MFKLTKKWDILVDPILMLYPDKMPSKREFLNGSLKLEYPLIKKLWSQTNEIRTELQSIQNQLLNIKFHDKFLYNQYYKRILDFFN